MGFVLHLSSPQPPSKGEPGSGGLGLVHFFDRRSVSAFWTVESPGAEQSPFEGGWGMTCKASPFISCGNLCKLDLQIFEKQHIKCKKINVLFCLPAVALAKAGARHSLGEGSLSPITNHQSQSPIFNPFVNPFIHRFQVYQNRVFAHDGFKKRAVIGTVFVVGHRYHHRIVTI